MYTYMYMQTYMHMYMYMCMYMYLLIYVYAHVYAYLKLCMDESVFLCSDKEGEREGANEMRELRQPSTCRWLRRYGQPLYRV